VTANLSLGAEHETEQQGDEDPKKDVAVAG